MSNPEKTRDPAFHAVEIAARAAEAARGYFRRPLEIELKPDESPVTQADSGIEALVRAYLDEHLPDHGIFGEELGITGGDRACLWIVDPIDGTRSFLSGHPLFGFLLGFLVHGRPEIGIVAMPALNEAFLATRGKGATLNGVPIHVSGQRRLDDATVYINEGERLYRDHPSVFEFLMKSGQTRRLAYDCYPHALLAAGHVDAVIDYGLQPYDYMPVSLLIEEAGGVMTDWDGQPLTLASDGRVISAASPELHAKLVASIGAVLSDVSPEKAG